MDDKLENAFQSIEDAQSVAFSTLNNNRAGTRMVNVVLIQEDGLYSITGRGRAFHHQLAKNPEVAICSTDATYVSISIKGEIEFSKDKTIT